MISQQTASTALRLMVSSIFIVHSVYRAVIAQTVSGFGEFFGSLGLPLGFYIAWAVTLFEFFGGISMALNRYTRLISLGFIAHQVMGITLVHFKNGWFVVGGGTNGVEYSLLILFSLGVILSNAKKSG